MRATLAFPAAFGLGVIIIAVPSVGRATDAPNADQIINSLTPPGNPAMLTRGIHIGGQPAAPGQPATDAGPGTVTPAKPPEASLSVPFATGSSVISPAAAHVLDQLGQALTSPKLADFKFRVEGHTDTVGQPDTNKVLSQQRAASVTEYLVSKYGIDRSRLTAVGMGEDGLLIATGPQVPNSANRRVLVVNLGR